MPPIFTFSLTLFTCVTVGRLHEIVPFLAHFYLGKLSAVLLIASFAMESNSLSFAAALRTKTAKCIAAVTALGVISVPTSYWPGQSAGFLQNTWPLIVLLGIGLLTGLNNPMIAQRTIAALTMVGALGAAELVAGGGDSTLSVLGDSAGAIVMQRAFISGGGSVTYDSNYSAAFFVMMLPYAMMFASRKGLLRWLAIPAVPVLGLGMLKTGSRGGIVALVVLAVCIVIFSDRKSRPKQVLILSIGLAAMLLSPHSELAARLRALVTGEDYNFDAPGGRWEVWSNGMTMLLRRPVVGVGMYAYGIANHDMGGGYTDAHNAYVQIAAELGLPGIAALIVMIVTAFKSALGMRRVNLAILRADPQNERASFAVALSTAALFALIAELTAAAFLSLAYEAMTMFALAVPVGLALNERGVPSAIAAVARSGATRLRGMRPRGATPRMPPQRPPTPAPTS